MAKNRKNGDTGDTGRTAFTVRLPRRTREQLRRYCLARSARTKATVSFNQALIELIEAAAR